MDEFVDVTMVDCLHRQRKFHNDLDKTVLSQERQDPIPEEIMAQLEDYRGDGKAHLTVSGSVSSNHEFHKAEAFVSISVTCNNNMDDVMSVHALVQPFVKDLVRVDHEEMALLRDEILPEGKKLFAQAEPKGKQLVAPPTNRPPTVPAGPSPSAQPRGATVAVKRPVPKPSFER